MKSILVKLKDETIHRRLKIAAADNGLSMGALIESALDAGLKPYERLVVNDNGVTENGN